MKRYPTSFVVLAGCLLAFISGGLNALEADKSEKIHSSHDGNLTMSTSGEFRILAMEENVKITQGSLQITGDEAIFEYLLASNELIRVTVTGSPVRYQQQLNASGGLATGTSDSLLLYTEPETGQNVLELIGTANISTPDSSMKCAAIVYLADQDIIREASGPCEGVINSQPN